MDQEKMIKSIKENRGILRQFTSLNNEVKELKGKVRKLEKMEDIYPFTKGEIANIKIGGTD